MRYFSTDRPIFYSLAFGTLLGWQLSLLSPNSVYGSAIEPNLTAQTPSTCQGIKQNLSSQETLSFFAVGGGPVPEANEIAIEKNVLYFQRTLRAMGYNPAEATILFASGNNRQATVNYVDATGRQRFKVPEIPNVLGASTGTNLQNAFRQLGSTKPNSVFFYFTGHGIPNEEDTDNNVLLLWNEEELTVREFASLLDRLPSDTSFVTMMSQCFSGSFANLIYQGGDPKRPVALQPRCGFFATVKTRPSIGCSPEVNEADYSDYSSSFFAALSGRSRTGKIVPSADYNKDGQVSYSEAHAFAKIDEKNTDWPISTSEAWLQTQADKRTEEAILRQPITEVLQTARSEQSYVVDSIVKLFKLNPEQSFRENQKALSGGKVKTEEQQAYIVRLKMELINIGMEKQIRASQNSQAIAILDRLIKCESGSWGKP